MTDWAELTLTAIGILVFTVLFAGIPIWFSYRMGWIKDRPARPRPAYKDDPDYRRAMNRVWGNLAYIVLVCVFAYWFMSRL